MTSGIETVILAVVTRDDESKGKMYKIANIKSEV
jgi:hypothetical protein